MMSNNDDLGHSLGSTNYRAELSLNYEDNNTLGTGVNAATSRINSMIFASSDPLSELVWSPRSGLNLKCADSSLPDHRPFFQWNVSPAINELRTTMNGIDDNNVTNDGNLIISSYDLNERRADRTDDSKAYMVTNWINNASMNDAIIRAIPIRSEPDKKLSQTLVWNMQCRQESDEEVTSASGKVNKNKTIMPNPNYFRPVLNPGALYREKGKDKEMSNGGSSDNSAESCNSAGLFSRGLKRRRDGEIGSKMTKKQIQESSFMNWISNVVKGHPYCNRVDEPSTSIALALAQPDNVCSDKSPIMGFHTIFQSLYCPNAKECFAIEDSRLSDKQIVLLNKEENVGSSDSSREQANIAGNNDNNNNNTSLWITRFYTRTDGLENCKQITEEARDSSAQSSKTNVDKISEAGDDSSVFVKRMDTLKHDTHQSEIIRRSSDHKKFFCYFCGESEHDLRICPQLTETEIDGLLVKIGSFEKGDEESPFFCVRCFQLGHWAISCPSSNADVARNVMDSTKFAPCNFAQNVDEMFCAIRKLRLSRADVLRWMNSNVSLLHLNGFFLRLRLRKLETGLGETGYYVARITEDTVQNLYGNSKKSILVDVGGIKSSVGSQYVSNHDFVEDEIKSWWSMIVKTGSKVPSLCELKSKAEDRTSLGF